MVLTSLPTNVCKGNKNISLMHMKLRLAAILFYFLLFIFGFSDVLKLLVITVF